MDERVNFVGKASTKAYFKDVSKFKVMTPYLKLKRTSDKYYENQIPKNRKAVFEKALQLLSEENIKIRPNAKLVQINFSVPESKKGCIVIGLRYQKQDLSFSEDHFLFKEGENHIQKGNGKKKWLERRIGEYFGSHKLQLKA